MILPSAASEHLSNFRWRPIGGGRGGATVAWCTTMSEGSFPSQDQYSGVASHAPQWQVFGENLLASQTRLTFGVRATQLKRSHYFLYMVTDYLTAWRLRGSPWGKHKYVLYFCLWRRRGGRGNALRPLGSGVSCHPITITSTCLPSYLDNIQTNDYLSLSLSQLRRKIWKVRS